MKQIWKSIYNIYNQRHAIMMMIITCFLMACTSVDYESDSSVQATMDDIVSRLNTGLSKEELNTIDQTFVLNLINDEEKESLSSYYWRFKVNVPVVVSVMRDIDQKIIPFWLNTAGFQKTEMTVSNGSFDYEVWQKVFPEGEVGLGINGFDRHRSVYFISVAPENAEDDLEISTIFPEEQEFSTLDVGQNTYSDWDELVLTEVPDSLKGQTLLTTFRGRAREAHLINAFRESKFPSSSTPDHIVLTWDADPSTSVVVQWRTIALVKEGILKYWIEGTQDTIVRVADRNILEDRLLKNDRYISRFSKKIVDLKSGKTYNYFVESEGEKSPVAFFKTAALDDEFSFIWFGDTHNNKKWGELLQGANKRFPDVAFYSITGDLVINGHERDSWDDFFAYSTNVFNSKPLMAVPGNRDSQDGLGASLFQSLLTYPANGPKDLSSGLSYAMTYKNALFLMLDVVSFSVEDQTAWINEQLAASDAAWKFVVFHFPPYNTVSNYSDIINEWVPIFDRYKVDIVMNGHYHYYMRTLPMVNSKPVENAKDGTVYITSLGARNVDLEGETQLPYAAKQFKEGFLFQHISIKGNELTYQCIDEFGRVRDNMVISK